MTDRRIGSYLEDDEAAYLADNPHGPPLNLMMVQFADRLIESVGTVAQEAVRDFPGRDTSRWHGRDFLAVLRQLRRLTDDDFMGLGAAPCPRGAGDFIIELGCRCETLGEALETIFRFFAMVTDAVRFDIDEKGGLAVIEVRQRSSEKDPDHLMADWNMVVCHKLSQWLIGEAVWIEQVQFDHPLRGSYAGYVQMFGVECEFNTSVNRLSFSSHYLARRVVRTPAEGATLIEDAPGNFTDVNLFSKPWKSQILAILRKQIAHGERIASLEDLADLFNVSSQTLRRRLRFEKTGYRELKARAREDAALGSFSDDVATIGAASISAGFSEPNGLSRALRSRHGESPRELREKVERWKGG